MIVPCGECGSSYDDEFRSALCPHCTFSANDGCNNFNHHIEAHRRFSDLFLDRLSEDMWVQTYRPEWVDELIEEYRKLRNKDK